MEHKSFDASSSSWVIEMEKLLEGTSPSVEMARWKQHSIYRVPEIIKKTTFRDAYQPQFVSVGPLHHGEPHLLPMEEHKRRAVLHVVQRAGKPLREFVAAIEGVVEELQGAYNDLDDKWRGINKGTFAEMMVTDGCFLLELIRIDGILAEGTEDDDDYAANDPSFSEGSFHNLWPFLRNDMIAMENQLPLVVLQRLLAVARGKSPSAKELNGMILRLLECPLDEEGMMDDDILGLHFLDIFHKSYGGSCPDWEGPADEYATCTPFAVELSEAGIQFKKSDTDSIHDRSGAATRTAQAEALVVAHTSPRTPILLA